MSQVRFCDRCGKPFSANEIGSQNVTALTITWERGRLSSTQNVYDLCAEDAIKPAGVEPVTVPKAIEHDDTDNDN